MGKKNSNKNVNKANEQVQAQVENTQAEVQTTDAQATDAQATDVQATDVQATDVQATDVQATDAQATDAQANADTAKTEAKRLMAEAKEAAAKAKLAAKEAKEAAAKAKALTQRPIRKRTFKAFHADDVWTVMSKSDVHYCVEKDAIDDCIRQRELWLEEGNAEVLIPVQVFSCSKENDEDRILICTVRVDQATNQIVIE